MAANPPIAGRPAEYIGAVGRFEVSARIEPSRLRSDEAATLFVTLHGMGDLANVRSPPLERQKTFSERFAVIGPVEKIAAADELTFRIPIRARDRSVDRVPRLHVGVYDPTPPRPGYRLLRTPEIAVAILDAPLTAAETFSPTGNEPTPRFGAGWPLGIAAAILAIPLVVSGMRRWWIAVVNARSQRRRISQHAEAAAQAHPFARLADALGLPLGRRTSAEIAAAFFARAPDPILNERLLDSLAEIDRRRFAERGGDPIRLESRLDEWIRAVRP